MARYSVTSRLGFFGFGRTGLDHAELATKTGYCPSFALLKVAGARFELASGLSVVCYPRPTFHPNGI